VKLKGLLLRITRDEYFAGGAVSNCFTPTTSEVTQFNEFGNVLQCDGWKHISSGVFRRNIKSSSR